MRRFATVRILTLSVLCGASTSAFADDGPPLLAPPAGHGPTSEAPADSQAPTPIPTPVAPKPVRARDNRPVLALPGITAPSSRSTRVASPRVSDPLLLPPPSLAPSADGGLPPIEVPSRVRDSRPIGGSSSTLLPLPSERFRPPLIESSPADDPLFPVEPPPARGLNGFRSTLPPSTGSGTGAARRSSADSLRLEEIGEPDRDERIEKDKDKDKDKDKAKAGRPETSAPRRRLSLFGGRFGLFPPPRGGIDTSSTIKAEPRTDPAADAEIKRRIERQARAAVGDRVKSLDVRVIGRQVAIQARGVKFLQKRPVRRTLESLPGLSGYRSTVDVLD